MPYSNSSFNMDMRSCDVHSIILRAFASVGESIVSSYLASSRTIIVLSALVYDCTSDPARLRTALRKSRISFTIICMYYTQ